jgi:hypothetical protein
MCRKSARDAADEGAGAVPMEGLCMKCGVSKQPGEALPSV